MPSTNDIYETFLARNETASSGKGASKGVVFVFSTLSG